MIYPCKKSRGPIGDGLRAYKGRRFNKLSAATGMIVLAGAVASPALSLNRMTMKGDYIFRGKK